MINANDAYEKSLKNHKSLLDQRLEDIECCIASAIDKGAFETNIDDRFIDTDLKEALENLGYKVERHNSQFEGAWTKISWNKGTV